MNINFYAPFVYGEGRALIQDIFICSKIHVRRPSGRLSIHKILLRVSPMNDAEHPVLRIVLRKIIPAVRRNRRIRLIFRRSQFPIELNQKSTEKPDLEIPRNCDEHKLY